MPPSEKVKRIIWTKSAGHCAKCREILCVPGVSAEMSHLIGDVAHIVAEEEDGPRGVSALTQEQRNLEPNLLLLCKPHHKQVDDDPANYTVEALTKMSLSHQSWVESCLSLSPVWDTKLFHLYYINVPRLSLLTSIQGTNLEPIHCDQFSALHKLGLELVPLMSRFKKVLQNVQLKALTLDLAVQNKDARGMVVCFNHTFRTKNIAIPKPGQSFETYFTGDLKKDAHIYCKLGGSKVIANIDRRWITTTTAFCHFRPSSGRNVFAGLGFVNSFDWKAKTMSVTPYVIGMPSNPAMEAFYGSND
jgi:hypothetical protein